MNLFFTKNVRGGDPPSPVSTRRAWRTKAAAGFLRESLSNPEATSVSAILPGAGPGPWPEPKEGGV